MIGPTMALLFLPRPYRELGQTNDTREECRNLQQTEDQIHGALPDRGRGNRQVLKATHQIAQCQTTVTTLITFVTRITLLVGANDTSSTL